MNIFNEEDDFLVTTPKQNYFSISKHANQNIVEMEFEKVLERLAVAEKLIEEKDLDEEFELTLHEMRAIGKMELEDRVNGLFLELAGNIVTQCE
jgi:flagellin-specific chaperone FliS